MLRHGFLPVTLDEALRDMCLFSNVGAVFVERGHLLVFKLIGVLNNIIYYNSNKGQNHIDKLVKSARSWVDLPGSVKS